MIPDLSKIREMDDGGCEVAVFSGPNALNRAVVFAGTYYESWGDPQGWSHGP